jgi:ATP-dependent DNA helicase RecG
MSVDERTRRNLERIFEAIEKRKATFGKALVGFTFSRNSKNELKVSFGLVNFLGKGDDSLKEETYDYGDFILTRRLMDVQDAIDVLKSIFEGQVLKLAGWPEIPLRVHLTDLKFIPSRSPYGYISSEWPRLYTYGNISDDFRGNIPSDSLSKLSLPLFPSGAEAINVFFALHFPRDWYSLESRVELLIPDYRARIKNLRLAGNRVTVDVETNVAPSDVRVKFYCRGENTSYMSEDLQIEGGQASFVADEEPFLVEAHIVSALDGGVIDKKRVDYRYPSREEGVIIENIEVQLLDMIDKGENVNVEFKKELSSEEFLETVVAFANTSGGIIFLGVDDNCRIKGFKEDVRSKIVDLIADHCDPPIEVQIDSRVLIQGTPITLVKVPEGTNKPYTLKERGIFVRRGSSDRQIKRTELDDIYAKKQSFTLSR